MKSRHCDRSPTFFRGRELIHGLTMLFLLVVLGLMFLRAQNPQSWQWLVPERRGASGEENRLAANSASSREAAAPVESAPTAGPTDQTPEEAAAARQQFEAIADRQPLAPEEMPAYWRLLKWSRNQTFRAMQQRARRDLLYTQLWEQPEKYRGQLIQLRLHLQRALAHEAPENSAGVKTVYEAWGWTDESKLPYLVVFSELPPGFPLGPDIRENAEFVGYFLKIMAYQSFDKQRAAPLLIGRLQWRPGRAPEALAAEQSSLFWLTLSIGVLLLLAVIGVWIYTRRKPAGKNPPPPDLADDAAYQEWLRRVEQNNANDANK